MSDSASFVRVSMSFLSIFVSLPLASRRMIVVGVSSTMRPLMDDAVVRLDLPVEVLVGDGLAGVEDRLDTGSRGWPSCR